jgi:hypothetical protein
MIPEFIVTWFMEKIWNKIFPKKNENLEIIKTYEERIQKLEKDKEEITQKHGAKEEETKRIVDSIKRRGFSTKRIIETYGKPLNAVFISYASQFEKAPDKNYPVSSHFLKEELQKYNSKYLGGTDVLIPPKNVPKKVKDKASLQKWFEEEILKGRYCKLKVLSLIDLRDKTFWGCYLPYKQKEPRHYMIGEVLKIDDLLTDEEIVNKLSIAQLIRDGDIVWLASRILSDKDLQCLHKNQDFIESSLGNPSLRILTDDKIIPKLTSVLKDYIEKPQELSKAIVEEAKFWESKIK